MTDESTTPTDDNELTVTDRDKIPEECQLCRPRGYRNNEIGHPEGMVEVTRDDGGTKIVHCCRRCSNELFSNPDFSTYDEPVVDDRECPVCHEQYDAKAVNDGTATFTHDVTDGVEVCKLPVPRKRCPRCTELLEHESKDPLEEFCIVAPCDYSRAEGIHDTQRISRHPQ